MIKIYTDGAFRNGKIAYAILVTGIEKRRAFGKCRDEQGKEVGHGNISAELAAIKMAIHYLKSKGEFGLIMTDLEGADHWSDGTWKRNLALTKEFFGYCQRNKRHFRIQWIRGHADDPFNKVVDKICSDLLNKEA